MTLWLRLVALFLLVASAARSECRPGAIDNPASPHAKLKSVELDAVKWTRGFWAGRFELARQVTFPSMWQVLQIPNNGSSYRHFRIAAGLEQGAFQSRDWSDGDFYKWVETGAYLYSLTGEKHIDRLMDEVIEAIGKAQAPDKARFDKDFLGGVTVLEGRARRIREGDWSGLLYRALRPASLEGIDVRLIPYYAWANRGISHMTVWIPLAD